MMMKAEKRIFETMETAEVATLPFRNYIEGLIEGSSG